MPIDPRALRTYLAVCRSGSISGAAAQLHLSQPSVSVTIRRLEDELEATLFERTRAGIILSPSGIALRRRAEALETLLESAEEEVRLVREKALGPLMVGGTPGALSSLVPPAIETLSVRHGHVSLRIIERSDSALIDLLRSERIDLAVVTTGLDKLPEDLTEEGISSDPFDLVVGAANASLPGEIELSGLGPLRWVLPDAAGAFRRQVDALFAAAGALAPTVAIRCDSLLTTKAIVRNTDYVTILPRRVVAPELRAGSLRAIRIADARFQRSIGIRRLKGRQLSPLAAAFLDAARAYP